MKISEFPQEKQDLISALPYRVGMFVSYADTDGGDESEAQERQACEAMITAYVEDFCKSELSQEVMNTTLKRRKDWKDWVQNLAVVPQECEEGINYLRQTLGDKEAHFLADNLIEIGFSVALAYREESNIKSLKLLSRLKSLIFGDKTKNASMYGQYVNVSAKEWDALHAVANAVGKPLNQNEKVA